MPYKIFINNQIYNIYCKTDRCEIRSGFEDQIQFLWFDPSARMCAVKIVNPSAHTQYLFRQGRLGVDLCYSNTGKGSRAHQGKVEGGWQLDVQYRYHPRWNRLMTTKTVEDLNYIEIPVWPNSKNSLQPHEGKVSSGRRWYTSIKGVLVSRNLSQSKYQERSYKTRSEKVRIKAETHHGTDFGFRGPRYQRNATNGLQAECTKISNNHLHLKFNITSDYVQEAFDQERLYITIAYSDVGSVIPSNNCNQCKWGLTAYGAPRWKTARSRTIDGPDSPEHTLKSIVSNSRTVLVKNLELDYYIQRDSASPRRMSKLMRLWRKHDDNESYLERAVYLKVFITGNNNIENNIHTLLIIKTPIIAKFFATKNTELI